MKHLIWIGLFFTFFKSIHSFGQEDSLLSAIGYYEAFENPTISDTLLVYQINKFVSEEVNVNPINMHTHAFAVYDLSLKMNYKKGIADGLRLISESKIYNNEIELGLEYADKAISYSKANNLSRGELNGYVAKGNGYYYKGQYDLATEQYFNAAEIAETHYEKDLAGCYGAIGNMFRASGQNEKSQEYLTKSLKLSRIYKDTANLGFALNNLGIVTKNLGDFEGSLKYYEEGLEIAIMTGNLRREGDLVYNMANVEFRLGNNKRGFELLDRSSEITAIIGSKRDVALEYYNIGYWHSEFKEYRKAIHFSLLAIDLAQETEYMDVLEASSDVLAVSYSGIGNYKEAYKYKEMTQKYADTIKEMTDKNVMLELEKQNELEKIAFKDSLNKEKGNLEIQHKQRLSEEKIKSRENLLYVAAGVIALVIFSLFQVFKSNKKIKLKNSIITEQKDEIEETHKEITDSINYAQKIQNALISGNEEWDKISPNHYILFKPKDVVSGDFYWAYHSVEENVAIWVTADCTGHGVPGAFMSMLGIGFLNEVIVENGNRKGAEILDKLRAKIIQALAQKGADQQQKDGMDMSLCIWDKNNNSLEFTGANNGLYLIRKTDLIDSAKFEKQAQLDSNGFSLIEFKPNKMPVGFQSEKLEKYSSQIIDLRKDDFLISFTDGYADQFGGEKGKKLKYKPFKELLLNICNEPVKLHSGILEDKFTSWKGDLEQIDDVCVIGVRV